jgi:hypothetical protein
MISNRVVQISLDLPYVCPLVTWLFVWLVFVFQVDSRTCSEMFLWAVTHNSFMTALLNGMQ